MKTDNKQLLCTAAIVAGGIFLLRKNKAVSGVGVIDRRYPGEEFLKANSAEAVLSILQRKYPNGVARATVYYSVTNDKKHHFVGADGVYGGRGVIITISKNTADTLVSEYGFDKQVNILYNREKQY